MKRREEERRGGQGTELKNRSEDSPWKIKNPLSNASRSFYWGFPGS
jgi:hypothetical protein